MTDPILAAAIAGDRVAFAQLYERHSSDLRAYVYSRVRGGSTRDDADDILSDVWLAVLKGIGGYEDRGIPFKAWLYTIAHARVATHYRRLMSPVYTPSPLEEWHATTEDKGSDPLMLALLHEAMGRLPARQRRALILRYWGGLDFRTVGLAFGLNAVAAKQLNRRAVLNLRKAFIESE